MRRVLVAVAFVAVVLVGAAEPAGACSCVGFSDVEAFDRADVVFRGDVLGRTEPRGAIVSSAAPVTWTFGVHEVLKGEASERQEIVSEWSGASCGLELADDAREVYVFASTEGSHLLPLRPGELYAGLCGGTRVVGDADLALGTPSPPRPAPAAPPSWAPYAVAGVVVLGLAVLVAVAGTRTRTGEPT